MGAQESHHEDSVQPIPVPLPKPKVKGTVEYEVTVETGTTKGASTSANVFIVLKGTKTSTREMQLKGSFDHGGTTRTRFTLQDLGEIWLIQLWKHNKGSYHDWFVNNIHVQCKSQGKKWSFPCHMWIKEREEIREARVVLPQHENSASAIQHRLDQLEKKRGIYQWQHIEGFPSAVRATYSHLPIEERWNDEKKHDFIEARNSIIKEVLLDKLLSTFRSWADFDDYKDLFTVLPVPEVHRNWQADEEFGKMRLYGASLTHWSKINEIPAKFPVTNDLVKKFLRPGTTLEQELQADRLFMLDFAVMEGLETQEGRYYCPCMCLLYINQENNMVPIAIQLFQQPDPVWNPIYTPADPAPDWLFAKMWVANSDMVLLEIYTHLMTTHLVLEPMIVATNRQLYQAHPVYKLIKPHVKYTLAINSLARDTLLAPEGAVVETSPLTYQGLFGLSIRCFANWRFDRSDMPTMLKERGITEEQPPRYYYRDDGIKIWHVMCEFVQEVMSVYYKSDDDVKNDFELQAWAEEIAVKGFKNEDKGFPAKITSVEQLCYILTTIMFTSSVQHASVNFNQYETFAFIPMTPAALFRPPPGYNKTPVTKGTIRMNEIWAALPPKSLAARQIGVLKLLSTYSGQDFTLGVYPETFFVEHEAVVALDNYRKKLKVISDIIEKRRDWEYLLPRRVPNSTAI